MPDRAQEVALTYPREITPALREVLGLMIFQTGPMARAFRAAGRAEIPTRAEDEHAFILHWLIPLALKHGPEWRRHAGEVLKEVIAEVKRRQVTEEGGNDA